MRVKMRTTMAGPQGVAEAGKPADLPKETALDLIEHGFATPIDRMPSNPAAPPKSEMPTESTTRGRRGRSGHISGRRPAETADQPSAETPE